MNGESDGGGRGAKGGVGGRRGPVKGPERVGIPVRVNKRVAVALDNLCEELAIRRGEFVEQVIEVRLRELGWLE